MATRLYLTSRALGVRFLGPPQGTWTAGQSHRDDRGLHHWTFLLAQTKDHGGVRTSGDSFGDVGGTGVPILAHRWVSDPLEAQTVDGTFQLCCLTGRTVLFTKAATLRLHVYLTQGDSVTPRAVLLDNFTDSAAIGTTIAWASLAAAQTLTSTSAEAGDRLVVELGLSCDVEDGVGVTNRFFMGWGTTNSSQVNLSDATAGSTNSSLAAWAEFSAALTFQAASAAPPNTDCTTATVIPSLPYSETPYDTTQAPGTNRIVWYQYTATVTGRHFATTWGGNYPATLRVKTGSCAALTNVSLGFRVPAWLGESQVMVDWSAVAGTTYWITIENASSSSGVAAQYTASQSGGVASLHVFAQSAVEADDLFVNCLWITRLRDGAPVCTTDAFYTNTPTGAAIDYSQIAVSDGSQSFPYPPNTDVRYVADLFGESPLVEMLDLTTLNLGESEIEFYLDPLNFPNHGQNLSSVVFDRSGRMIFGFYGDAYDVIGSLSSPSACAVRRLPNTHGDLEPGAPWPEAESFTIQQDIGGSDFVELAADQDTIWYTSAGRTIFRYSLGTATQLANFVTLPVEAGPRPGLRSLRLLPPGDGSGGLLVCDGINVKRLDSTGTVIQTYTPSATDRAQDLDKVELTQAADAFWVSDQYSASLFKFDLATGIQLADVDLGLPAGQLSGFTVYLGYRAGVSTASTGAIRVEKVIVPPDATLFDFLAGGGLTPTTFQLGHGGIQDFLELVAGAGYTIEEVANPAYGTVYTVSNGSPISDLLVVAGETTVVVVTNTRTVVVCPPISWLTAAPEGCVTPTTDPEAV